MQNASDQATKLDDRARQRRSMVICQPSVEDSDTNHEELLLGLDSTHCAAWSPRGCLCAYQSMIVSMDWYAGQLI